jgi:heterotetrameric sarcosine oxidase delta subunit
MASLISCPHCGVQIKGDAVPLRPSASAPDKAWHDYIFIRPNPMGRHKEFWHHVAGCRRFLVVERDTVTHEVFSVEDATAFRLGDAK